MDHRNGPPYPPADDADARQLPGSDVPSDGRRPDGRPGQGPGSRPHQGGPSRTERIRSASRAVASGSRTAARGTVRGVRRLTQAQGMGESGLSKLIEVHAFHMGGDAAMMVGLAGTRSGPRRPARPAARSVSRCC